MSPRRAPGGGPDELDADLITEPLDGPPGSPDDAPTELTSELDLHHFQPRECADLVTEYLRAAHAAGLATVRIIHGKGTGAMRRTVHSVLAHHPAVRAYRLAPDRGTWGATIVELDVTVRAP